MPSPRRHLTNVVTAVLSLEMTQMTGGININIQLHQRFLLGSSWKQRLVLNIFTISRPGTSDFVIWELWCGWPEEFDCEKNCFDWGCSWGPCGESQARGCEAVEQLRTWKGEVEWHGHVQKPGDSPKLGLRAPKVNPEVTDLGGFPNFWSTSHRICSVCPRWPWRQMQPLQPGMTNAGAGFG